MWAEDSSITGLALEGGVNHVMCMGIMSYGKMVGVLVLAMVGFGAFNALARYAGRFTETQLSSNAFMLGCSASGFPS